MNTIRLLGCALALLLVQPRLLVTANPSPQGGGPDPILCNSECNADTVSQNTAAWSIAFSNRTDGRGTNVCETCTQCKAVCWYTYTGTAVWNITLADGSGVGGSGFAAGVLRMHSLCDDMDAGHIHFSDANGESADAYLFCPCTPSSG